MNAFRIALTNESLKQKGTLTIDTVLFLPVAIVLLFTLYLGMGAKTYSSSANPWLNYYGYALYILSVAYPLLAAVLGHYMQEIEYRSAGYLRAFLFPVRKFTLFQAKVALTSLVICSSLLLCFLTIVVSGRLLDWWEPAFGFRDFDSIRVMATYFIRFFSFLLTFSLIHFWIGSFRVNMLVSLGIAIFILAAGAFIGISENYYWLFPGTWLRNVEFAVSLASKKIITTWFITDWLWAIAIFSLAARRFSQIQRFE